MQANGQHGCQSGCEAVGVQQVGCRVQEEREAGVGCQKGRHHEREGQGAGQVQVDDAAIDDKERQ